jgi:hypothetical protein
LFRNGEDNLSCHENNREQAPHAINRLDAHIFNIQTLFFPKDIGTM